MLRISGFALAAAMVLALGAPAATAQSLDESFFTREVWPIFQENCFKCHSAESQKGELRLDFPEAIRRGGEFGEIITAGEPDDSVLIELISLPADDPDVMPGEGEKLTDEQIATLRRWVEGGAPYGDWTPEFAFKSMGLGTIGGAPEGSPEATLEAIAANVAPAPQEAVDAVAATGAVAGPLSQDNPLLQVGFHLLGDQVKNDTLKVLEPIKEQVTWLNLAGTSITDDGLAMVAQLPNLTRLHLEKTNVSDPGLTHLAGLKQLEYLNLYDTNVTDGGIGQLSGLANLKKLYLWQSKVTDTGADQLRAAIPDVDINMGVETEAPAAEPTEQTADAESLVLARFFDAEGCCAKANATGEACSHDCCKEAAAKNEVCTKCNAEGAKKFAITKLFDEGGCCAKAHAENKDCDHPCCVEAFAKAEVCAKCNPGAAEKLAS